MTFAKIIERKKEQSQQLEDKKKKQQEILSDFRAYVTSVKAELEELFPYVIIGEQCDEVLGLSYTGSRTTLSRDKSIISSSTYNIVMGTLNSRFNIGYGANTCNGTKWIPFSTDMTKAQLRITFRHCVEALVSKAYSEHSERDWKKREEIKEYNKTHKQMLRKDLNHRYMVDNAEMFQRGGTHDYFKMDGKLFVSAYGREIYEFIARA
ncbi:hypothetical protein D3C87_75680 [compost metagenome]